MISTQFSAQRRWLTEKYNGCTSVAEQEDSSRMGDLATLGKAINFDLNKLAAT